MALIKNFRELNVYKAARVETQKIYSRSRNFPVEERYSLTDQIRRSSRAVKAMIAEAWARRRYRAVFINKIIDNFLGFSHEFRINIVIFRRIILILRNSVSFRIKNIYNFIIDF